MATADELLNRSSMTNSEAEGHIVIDNNRHITVPDALKRIAVEADHNVETVTFECPKYWDKHDLSQMAIYINCKLPNGEVVSFLANTTPYLTSNTNATDTIMFDWTITRTLSKHKGNITFLVCAKSTEVKGDEVLEKLHWNTELCNDMYVSEGLEADLVVEEEYPDIVSQLVSDMAAVKAVEGNMKTMLTAANTAKGAAETAETNAKTAKGAAETAAKTVSDNAAEIRNSYANAIKGNVSGEIVRVDDVSPLEHDVDIRVYGKNLFDVSKIPTTESGVSSAFVSEVGDDYVIVSTLEGYTGNGYCTVPVKVRDACPSMQVGKTYILNAITESDSSNIYLPGLQRSWVFGTTMVATEELLNSTMTLYGFSMGSGLGPGQCRISKIQIEEGSVATEHESYINPDEVEVIRYGKNLVDSAQYITPRTVSGVTVQYLPNEDAFLFNGTATSAARIGYSQLIGACEGEQFTCTIIPISGSVDKGTADYPPVIFFGKSDTKTGAGTNNISFQLTDTKTTLTQRVSGKYLKDSWFWISVGNILTNYKVRIQFERGNIATEYEQYQGRSTDADGIKSVSPTMTIFTNTPGAIIEAEYNRDTTKMFESYVLSENAKEEISVKVKNYISPKIDAIEAQVVEIQESIKNLPNTATQVQIITWGVDD